MKKIIFTAIAVIAFSTVSIANTIYVDKKGATKKEEVNVFKLKNVNVKKVNNVAKPSACEEAAGRVFVQAVLADIPVNGAYNLALAVYAVCTSFGVN
jgi:hypothetical protein